jgi:hypothetical protein
MMPIDPSVAQWNAPGYGVMNLTGLLTPIAMVS